MTTNRFLLVRRQLILASLVLFLSLSAMGGWTRVLRPGYDFRSLAFSDTVLFGVGSTSRVNSTTDGGQTWTDVEVNKESPLRILNRVRFFPEVGLLGGGDGQIYVLDQYNEFQPVQSDVGTDDILAFAASRGKSNVVFLAGGFGGGVSISNDIGKSWVQSNQGLQNLNVTALESGPSLPDSSGQTIFAGTYGNGVFASTDNGAHWFPKNQGMENYNVNAMDEADDVLYASGNSGIVMRSTDWGSSWQQFGHGLPSTDIICVAAIDIPAGKFIYCGTIDQGVWRCPATGGSWTSLNAGLASLHINSIVAKGTGLYIGTQEGVYRSSDGGTSWTSTTKDPFHSLRVIHAVPPAEPNGQGALIVCSDGSYIAPSVILWSAGLVFSTMDDGKDWNTAGTLIPGGSITVTHRDGLVFLLPLGNMDRSTGLHISSNMGFTWEEMNDLNPIYAIFNCLEIVKLQGDSSLSCFFGSNYGGISGVLFSSDTGRSWTRFSDKRAQSIGSQGACLLVTVRITDGFLGTFRTSDRGSTWDDITEHLAGNQVLSFVDDGERLLARIAYDPLHAQSGGVLMTTDAGDSWRSAGLGGRTVTSLAPIGIYLVAAADGRVYVAKRETLNWVDVTDDLAGGVAGMVTATPQSYYILSADGQSIWKRPMSEVLTKLSLVPERPLLVSPLKGAVNQPVSVSLRWSHPALSTLSWLQVCADSNFGNPLAYSNASLADTFAQVTGLTNGRTYYWRVASGNATGFSSWSDTWSFTTLSAGTPPPWNFTNTGTSHTIIIPSSTIPSINGTPLSTGDCIGVFYDSSGTLACAGYQQWTGTGNAAIAAFGDDATTTAKDGFAPGEVLKWAIWRQRDSHTFGANATYISPGGLGGIVTDTSKYTTNGISALATLTVIFISVSTPDIPTQFTLMQNYPNPFNPSTTIRFGLPERSRVRLIVYNALGEQVAQLIDGDREAGYHAVSFNAAGLASGVYFYRITAGTFVDTKRLLFIR